MNYIITKNIEYFKDIGNYNFCNLEDMILPEIIAIDTETTGLEARKCEIFCVQIGTGINNYIIHMYDNNYEFKDLIPYINDKILIGHNILFDLGFMYKYGFYPKEVRDTMLASKILYNGDVLNIRHDFGSMMKRELNIVYDKTDQKNIHIVKLSQPSTILYSFNDVDKLIEAHTVLKNKIIEGGFEVTYNLHCRFIKALAYMEQCGLPISIEKWQAKMTEDILNAKTEKKKIEEYIYDNISSFRNPQLDLFTEHKEVQVSLTSPLQMIKVFNELGINTKDKDDKNSINENIISKSHHEFVSMWLKFQNANHRVTTFGQKILDKVENNRIYTSFNPMVDTARLSSRRGGINFLNFPSDKITRYCFECKEDDKMIVCDWSSQEGVIMADLSGDIAMTASVVDGIDLHCLLTKTIFPELKDLTDEEIKEHHHDKRQFSKIVRFSESYGGNGFTIHTNQNIPLDEANRVDAAFKELHSGLYEWGKKIFNIAILVGYIESADGWKLKLPKFDLYKKYDEEIKQLTKNDWTLYKEGKQEYLKYKKGQENKKPYIIKKQRSMDFYMSKKTPVSNYFKLKSEYMRLCLNNPVQSRGSMMLKLALANLFDWIIDNNYINKILICNSVHDEIILETTNELAEIAKNQLQLCMVEAGNHYLTNLTIKADASIGQSWGEAK